MINLLFYENLLLLKLIKKNILLDCWNIHFRTRKRVTEAGFVTSLFFAFVQTSSTVETTQHIRNKEEMEILSKHNDITIQTHNILKTLAAGNAQDEVSFVEAPNIKKKQNYTLRPIHNWQLKPNLILKWLVLLYEFIF